MIGRAYWLLTAYLYSSLKHYTPSRTLRSSDSKLLFVPRVHTCFGSRSFAVAAATIWNSLPLAIRSSVSTYSFRRQLKTCFYRGLTLLSGLFNPPLYPAPQIRRSLADSVRSTNLLTYLLTLVS